MDTSNVNQIGSTRRTRKNSPVLQTVITQDSDLSLIKQAAAIETEGNVSAFIKQTIIKAAHQVVQSHNPSTTLAS